MYNHSSRPRLTNVTFSGNSANYGSGTITSAPAGIDCGATCTATLAENGIITLTATADTISAFTGWSGDCTGAGFCVITMDAAKQVTATFDQVSFPVYLPVVMTYAP